MTEFRRELNESEVGQGPGMGCMTEFRRELNESEVGQGPGMGCMTELGSRHGLHDSVVGGRWLAE